MTGTPGATPVRSERQEAGLPGSWQVVLVITVSALGYFVDIYDLILFSIVRVASLRALGVPENEVLSTGVFLLNMQMAGMLIGGLLWGILGDKRGRLSVLFGSIIMYSLANILNGMVTSVDAYAALRLLAGIGLAGELGAGITLVSESMSKENRGYGTMIVAAFGILGAIAAGFVGDLFGWRNAYYVGGSMGLALLVMRVGVYESGAFLKVAQTSVQRGNFFTLFSTPAKAWKYLCLILIALPTWFVTAILVTFSPEFGTSMGMDPIPSAGTAVMWLYFGTSIGGFLSGMLSQIFQTRKKVVQWSIVATGILIGVHFWIAAVSLTVFYSMCLLLGLAIGYWAIFLTIAAEHVGTNIRATVATTVPNFVRGAVVPMTLAFEFGRQHWGVVASGLTVGLITVIIALIALRSLDETYGKDLDYIEP